MEHYDMVLRIVKNAEKDLVWFFQTTHYWKHGYHTDVSNDIVLFAQMGVIPEYVKDFFNEMERRKKE